MTESTITQTYLIQLKTATADNVPAPGNGPILFADSADRPTVTIRAKTPDGKTHDLVPQTGSQALTAGTTALLPATITATSRIFLTVNTADTTTSTTEYAALAADRVVGIGGDGGGFKITALVAAGTINVADVSTIDWMVVN